MANIYDTFSNLEKTLIQEKIEYLELCECKYCGTRRPLAANTKYNIKHKYNCHCCGAEYKTDFNNWFFNDTYGRLYDRR